MAGGGGLHEPWSCLGISHGLVSELIHKVAGDTHYLPPQSSPSHPILPSRAPWGAARVSKRVACGGQVSAPSGGWGEWQPPLLGTARMTPSWTQSRAGPEPILARRIPSVLPGLGRACSPRAGPVSTAHGPGCGGSRPRSGQNVRDSGDSDATPDPHPSPRLGWAAPLPGHSLTEGSRLFEAPERWNFPLTNPSSLSTQIVHALEPKRETFLVESPHFPNGEAEAWGG